jgi:hypothetical protein
MEFSQEEDRELKTFGEKCKDVSVSIMHRRRPSLANL